MPSLIQTLREETVLLQLAAETSEEVVNALADRLHRLGYVHDTFAGAVMQRETKHPTGLVLSGSVHAAIPHTDPQHVIRAGLALATLEKEVVFQNMIAPEEAVPVRLVFLMALDQGQSQIEMLVEIARILQNEDLVNGLIAARDFSEVQALLAGMGMPLGQSISQ